MNENSISLVYSIVLESIKAQNDQRQSLESKASTLIAFAGGMFALLMGARNSILSLPCISLTLVQISIFLFFVSVILCTIASWVRRFYVFPNLDKLAEKYQSIPENETKKQLILNMKLDWNENHNKLEKVANQLRYAFFFQVIAFILLGLSLLFSFF